MIPGAQALPVSGRANQIQIWLAKRAFGAGTRVRFYRRFADFLRDGVPLRAILDEFRMRFIKRKKSTGVTMLNEWIRIIDGGGNITDALRGWATKEELMAITAGQESSALHDGFRAAADYTESRRKIRSLLIGALAYPIFLLVALMLITRTAAYKLMPAFAEVIPVDTWPDVGKAYYDFSLAVKEHGGLMVLGIGVFFLLVFLSLPRIPRGGLRNLLDKLPIYNTYKVLVGSSVLMALGAQVRSAVPVKTAIQNILQTATPYLASHLRVALRRIGMGEDAGSAMDTGLFDEELADDLIAYSRHSNFAEALEAIGRRLTEDTMEKVKVSAGLLNAAVMIVVAMMIIWMLTAIGMTAFEFADKAQAGVGM